MTKSSLVIMAAGIGSRFGGAKQLEPFGPSGERLMDYAIFDAIRLGFEKVVIVVRKETQDEFNDLFAEKLHGKIGFETVVQHSEVLLPGTNQTVSRQKPWGTGQALLSASKAINGSFVVINADDFYGRKALDLCSRQLEQSDDNLLYALISYRLDQTLSEHGSVSRAVCSTNLSGKLSNIYELVKIKQHEDGKIYDYGDRSPVLLAPETPVSMNCWGFKASIFERLEGMFQTFLKNNYQTNNEFLLPRLMLEIVESKTAAVQVIPVETPWFGVTYPQDKELVVRQLNNLIAQGLYPEDLWK
ncbi:MAG: nucleotidyltransferase family protein [Bacteroidales bacterium]